MHPVHLVQRNDEGAPALLQQLQGFHGLGLQSVHDVNDQNRDVAQGGASVAKVGEGFVSRCIDDEQTRNLNVEIFFDFRGLLSQSQIWEKRGTDLLRDATCFSVLNVRTTNFVQQLRLSRVDVTHDAYNGRTIAKEIVRTVRITALLLFLFLCFFLFCFSEDLPLVLYVVFDSSSFLCRRTLLLCFRFFGALFHCHFHLLHLLLLFFLFHGLQHLSLLVDSIFLLVLFVTRHTEHLAKLRRPLCLLLGLLGEVRSVLLLFLDLRQTGVAFFFPLGSFGVLFFSLNALLFCNDASLFCLEDSSLLFECPLRFQPLTSCLYNCALFLSLRTRFCRGSWRWRWCWRRCHGSVRWRFFGGFAVIVSPETVATCSSGLLLFFFSSIRQRFRVKFSVDRSIRNRNSGSNESLHRSLFNLRDDVLCRFRLLFWRRFVLLQSRFEISIIFKFCCCLPCLLLVLLACLGASSLLWRLLNFEFGDQSIKTVVVFLRFLLALFPLRVFFFGLPFFLPDGCLHRQHLLQRRSG
mmetsp:Transcript_39728/g.105176  ORF Transcript_39728/g.105176 Transcript_39728/m.105176 type:complete len:521 (-) Transcript_39728:1181-2743(-)